MSTKGISVLILLKIDIGKRKISKSSRQKDPCRCCGKAYVAVCCSCVLLSHFQTKISFFTPKCNEKSQFKDNLPLNPEHFIVVVFKLFGEST